MLRLVFAGAFGCFTRYCDKAFVDLQYLGIFIRPRYCLQGKPPVRRAFGVTLHLDAKSPISLIGKSGHWVELCLKLPFFDKNAPEIGRFQHGGTLFLQLGICDVFW